MVDDDEFAFHDQAHDPIAYAFSQIENAAQNALEPEDLPEWDIDEILPVDDAPAIVFSEPGALKSWIALEICDALARGRPFVGLKTRKRPRVLFVNVDAGKRNFKRRMRAISDAPAFDYITLTQDECSPRVVEAMLERYAGGFVVFDCLSSLYDPEPRADPNTEMRRYISHLRALYEKHRVGGLLVDHSHRPKFRGDDGDFSGPQQKRGAIRGMWIVSAAPPSKDAPGIRQVKIVCRKMSEGAEFKDVHIEVEFGKRVAMRRGNVLAIPPAESLVRNAIIAWARVQTNSFTQTDAANAGIGTGKTTGKIAAFKQLVDEGVFEVAQTTGRGFRYRLSTNSSRVPELLGTLGTASESGTVPAVPPLIGGTASGNSSESAMKATDDDRPWIVDTLDDEAI